MFPLLNMLVSLPWSNIQPIILLLMPMTLSWHIQIRGNRRRRKEKMFYFGSVSVGGLTLSCHIFFYLIIQCNLSLHSVLEGGQPQTTFHKRQILRMLFVVFQSVRFLDTSPPPEWLCPWPASPKTTRPICRWSYKLQLWCKCYDGYWSEKWSGDMM